MHYIYICCANLYRYIHCMYYICNILYTVFTDIPCCSSVYAHWISKGDLQHDIVAHKHCYVNRNPDCIQDCKVIVMIVIILELEQDW